MISISTLDSNPSQNISQENYFESLDVALSSKILSELFQLQGNGNHPTIAAMMNEILYRENTGKSLTVSQQTLATKVGKTTGKGLSRLQAGKILRILANHGALERRTPHHQNHTYIPSKIFKNPALRLALKHLLPELDDEYISKRKDEGDEMCAMKVAKNYYAQSYKAESIDLSDSNYDFEVGQQKMHHSLKGIDIIENLSTLENMYECDDGALLPYVEFDFDNPSTYTYTGENKIHTGEINQGKPTKGVGEDLFSPNISLKSESISVPNKRRSSTEMQALPTVKDMIPYADKLQSIRPLLHGAIILSAFPEEVVLHSDQRTLKCKKPLPTALDRWKYLISVCKGYCTENNIETSWSMTLNIRDKYNIHKDTPMFDENHAPISTPIYLKGKSTGIPTQAKQVTYEEAVRNNQQWANSAPHINKEEEFSNAISTLESMAATNPFAALLMKNVQQAQPQTVGCPQSVVAPVKPFDDETIQIVEWIKSNWDDTLFPHSNKWVRDNIARVLSEGPSSPQYLNGDFLNGMKRIKMLMVELLKKPKVQSIPVQVQPIIDEDEQYVDYSSDPFGDRL